MLYNDFSKIIEDESLKKSGLIWQDSNGIWHASYAFFTSSSQVSPINGYDNTQVTPQDLTTISMEAKNWQPLGIPGTQYLIDALSAQKRIGES